MKPIAAKHTATKANTGPPVVDMNMPVAATSRAPATQACWNFQRAEPAAKAYMARIEISQGIELKKPTCMSLRSPMRLMMLGSQKVAA
ncbi:hypothetical protein D3C79_865430 [compost metagenome]